MKERTRKMVMAAMFAALICVATMIKVPLPSNFGYVNLGDCFVLAAGFIISPFYAFFAAAIGSAMADVFSGYLAYAVATFLIKGAMALLACFVYRSFNHKIGNLGAKIAGGVLAELVMVFGYFLFEGLLYGGFPVAAVNIPFNGVQGAVGLVAGVLLTKIAEKINFRG